MRTHPDTETAEVDRAELLADAAATIASLNKSLAQRRDPGTVARAEAFAAEVRERSATAAARPAPAATREDTGAAWRAWVNRAIDRGVRAYGDALERAIGSLVRDAAKRHAEAEARISALEARLAALEGQPSRQLPAIVTRDVP